MRSNYDVRRAQKRAVDRDWLWIEDIQGRHGAEIHAMTVKRLAADPSLDEPQVLSRDVPAEDRAVSPYVQECLKPAGIVDTCNTS